MRKHGKLSVFPRYSLDYTAAFHIRTGNQGLRGTSDVSDSIFRGLCMSIVEMIVFPFVLRIGACPECNDITG